MPDEMPDDLPMGDSELPSEPNNEKPFDDAPFDAGVEADEENDPKKYIQQLSGKLGQSLRKYSDESGQPDLELEKFAINSVVSATHTSDMDQEDKEDIINKINSSGTNNDDEDSNNDIGIDDESGIGDAEGENAEEIKLESIEVFDKERKPLFADPTLGVDTVSETVVDIFAIYLKEDFADSGESDIFVRNDDMNDTEPAPAPAPARPSVAPERRTKRKDKPFQIPTRPAVSPQPKALKENSDVYHETFSSAMQKAREYVESKGYELNDDEWFNMVSTGPRKPSPGDTNRYSLTLYKNGKEMPKALHVQVYNTGSKYELNAYVN